MCEYRALVCISGFLLVPKHPLHQFGTPTAIVHTPGTDGLVHNPRCTFSQVKATAVFAFLSIKAVSLIGACGGVPRLDTTIP